MNKHTPGPWEAEITDDHSFIHSVSAMKCIAQVDTWGDETCEHDALLIAAAPDLLEACKANHEWHLMYDDTNSYRGSELWVKNTEAIAKAEGKEAQDE